MKKIISISILLITLCFFYSFTATKTNTYSLTVGVDGLRNSDGVVQFALYNKEGSIPDDHFENYYKILKAKISDGSSFVTFNNIPLGKYAVNILHDENLDGKIDKGFILPTEGIGFSNFQSVGLTNRPSFSKASFDLKENKTILVKVIYM